MSMGIVPELRREALVGAKAVRRMVQYVLQLQHRLGRPGANDGLGLMVKLHQNEAEKVHYRACCEFHFGKSALWCSLCGGWEEIKKWSWLGLGDRCWVIIVYW
jgi:hypothetical protein